jgi:tRNA(Ile)-lysidine synthase
MSKPNTVSERFLSAMASVSREDRLLLACSGGLDSVVLAHLLHEHNFNFSIVHCNFQLRGKEADEDAIFVLELARSLDVVFHCTIFSTKQEQRPGESLQMAARRLRYNYFEKLLDEYNYRFLLTGHHLDDGLETLLINLNRGTGLAGLRGVVSANRTLRPLGTIPRAALAAFAGEENIAWREDASNAGSDYLRNQIRHALIPTLKDVLPDLEKTLPNTFGRLQTQFRLFDTGLRLMWEKAARRTEDTWEVDLRQLPTSSGEQLYLLQHFLGFAGLGEEQWLKGLSSSSRITLKSATHQAYFANRRMTLSTLPDPVVPVKISWESLPVELTIGDQTWRLERVPRPEVRQHLVQYLSLAPQDFPLHLRPRQSGDRFKPSGMGGKSQSLKNYVTNNKLSQRQRDELRVLETAGGEIAAVVGYRISELFVVRDKDETVIQLFGVKK